jgi:DNA-directed RNA polymerase specialized sigma24 family protein
MGAPSAEITTILKAWSGGDPAALERPAPRQAKVVELRYFGGLSEEEIVAALNISPRTVRRDWDFAEAWLSQESNR